MRANVLPLLTAVPETGTNSIIVGHDDLFEAGTGIYPDPQGIAYVLEPDGNGGFEIVANLLPEEWVELDGGEPVNEAFFDFEWTGQIAGFSVEGQFSYDANKSFVEGIVREEDLLSFDISFFDPNGGLLRTYEDNHLTFPEFNFAYDTTIGQILTDGIFTEPDGLNVGEKTAVGDNSFTGLNLWSKSKETSSSLLHVDDWSDEFGFPIGYSTHEDIAFLTKTTAELIETGKVGEFYLEEIQDSLDEIGQRITVTPDDLPVVSLFIEPGIVAEDSDNPSFVGTFTIEGDIPEEGLPVVIGGSFLTQPSDLTDGNIPAPWLPEGSFVPTGPIFDEDGNLTGFIVTIFESSTSANPFIFDDIIEEEPLNLLYSILPGEGYIVGQGDASLTVIDGPSVIPGSGPTVSLSVSDTDLEEGDEFTVSFEVDGEIPEGGLPVYVDGSRAALSEFNIFGDDGIDPETDIVGLTGLPQPDKDAGGFLATLTENQASITLSVFEDGPNEGEETLTFDLVNGEQYEVDSDASSVNLTINDGAENAVFTVDSGVTSVFLDLPLLETATGIVLVGADSEATPFSEDFQVGFAITPETDFSFAPVPFAPVDGTIEHSGTITLGLGEAQVTIGEFSIGFDPSRVSDTASGFFVADTLEDPLGLEVLFDISAPGVVSVASDDFEISDADLLLAPELANALGQSDLAGADIGDARVDAIVSYIPQVSLTLFYHSRQRKNRNPNNPTD